jgi:Spy/CpxP family protein refolding chaperone
MKTSKYENARAEQVRWEDEGKESSMKVSIVGRLVLGIAGVLMAGTLAIAQGPGDGRGAGSGVGPGFGQRQPPFERALRPQGDRGRWWNNPKMVERLKLTDEQRKAMDEILLQHREKLVDLRGSLEKAELEMEPLMGGDQPNEAKVLSQIDKVAQARAELEKANARFLLAIRGKLTPEQWKQVQEFRANRGQQRERGEWGGQGGQRPEMRGPGMRGPGGQNRQQMPPAQPAPQGAPAPGPGTGDVQ